MEAAGEIWIEEESPVFLNKQAVSLAPAVSLTNVDLASPAVRKKIFTGFVNKFHPRKKRRHDWTRKMWLKSRPMTKIWIRFRDSVSDLASPQSS